MCQGKGVCSISVYKGYVVFKGIREMYCVRDNVCVVCHGIRNM